MNSGDTPFEPCNGSSSGQDIDLVGGSFAVLESDPGLFVLCCVLSQQRVDPQVD
jgi:hypothetical protein